MITDKKGTNDENKGLSVVHSEGMESETGGKTEFDVSSICGDNLDTLKRRSSDCTADHKQRSLMKLEAGAMDGDSTGMSSLWNRPKLSQQFDAPPNIRKRYAGNRKSTFSMVKNADKIIAQQSRHKIRPEV